MADELEVLEKQQLSAQRSLNDLTDQLTLADHLVPIMLATSCSLSTQHATPSVSSPHLY